MAQEWHYEKSGKTFGPISSSELREKANAGELLPSDLIWREGMKDWKAARSAKGLFPEALPTASVINRTPVGSSSGINEKRVEMDRETDEATEPTTTTPQKFSFKETAIAAAKFGAAQAERAKLSNVVLPKQYMALGRECLTAGDVQAEFSEQMVKLNQIQSEINRLKDHEAGKAISISEKAKAAADYAVRSAKRAKLSFEHSSLLSALGKVVYEKHGCSGSSENLTSPIQISLSRVASLDNQIAALSQSSNNSWITPSRFLIAALVLFALGGFWGLRIILSHSIKANVATALDFAPVKEKSKLLEKGNSEIIITSGDDIAKLAATKFPPHHFEKGPNGEEMVVEQHSTCSERYYLDSTGKRFNHGITKCKASYGYKVEGSNLNITRYSLCDKGKLVALIDVTDTGKPIKIVVRKSDDEYLRDMFYYNGDEVIHLRKDYRFEGDKTILLFNPFRVDNPPLQKVRGRSIPISVSSAGLAKKDVTIERFFNPSIKNPTCGIENNRLYVAFNIDISKWYELLEGRHELQFGLLLRIFDKSGNYITHFHTRERFCATFSALIENGERHLKQQEVLKKISMPEDKIFAFPTFLFPSKNVLTYTIAEDAAQKAAVVEVSFFVAEFN